MNAADPGSVGSDPGKFPGPIPASSSGQNPAPARRLAAVLAGCLLALVGIAVGPVSGTASAATITVSTVADTTADNGVCSLREAITAANSNTVSGAQLGECQAGEAAPVVDRIEFSFIGTISLGSSLPVIREVLDVDGTPVPGEVRVDGGSPGFFRTGFDISAEGVTIRGLTITNFDRGVVVNDATGVTVRDNLIGTDAVGTTGLGNDESVTVDNAADALVKDNVIADGEFGIRIVDSGSSGSVIVGNRIGTEPNGTVSLGNNIGIDIERGASDTRIGGTNPAARNLISGNDYNAIKVVGYFSYIVSGTRILGNRIGTSSDGTSALPNGTSFFDNTVLLDGGVRGSEIRGNLISGNTGPGVLIKGSLVQSTGVDGPSNNVIAGNLIGVDVTGEFLLSNGGPGVEFDAGYEHPAIGNRLGGTSGLTSGGACTGDCNVIAAVSEPAVVLSGSAHSGTVILGNHIGVDLNGNDDTDGGEAGVLVGEGADTRIGQPGAPNVIANADDGIRVEGPATGTTIQSNLMGYRSDGSADSTFRFAEQAIEVTATEALVGGTGADRGNRIANADGAGVLVGSGADRVAVLRNSIVDSGELGIDLDPVGVTLNDSGAMDADAGANGLQNFPVLEASVGDGSTNVAGAIDSSANSNFRLEFFGNAAPDPSGHGEGGFFLGSTTVMTDTGGQARFAAALPVPFNPGARISATATRLDGAGDPLATSEFAANIVNGSACDLVPTAGDDVLCGTTGADVIDGLGGDDIIFGLGGGDQIDGSTGDDRIVGDTGQDTITGGGGKDLLYGGAEDDTLFSRDEGEPDIADCGAGSDTAIGDEADEFNDCEVTANDTTPPETTIDSGPAAGSSQESDSATFSFSSSEPGSTFGCVTDGAAEESCISPYDLSGLALGTHTFSVWATDESGNADPTPASVSFTAIEPDPGGDGGDPDGNGGDPGGGGGSGDSQAPVLTLSGHKNQKDKKKVLVKAKCDEVCDLVATGSIRVKILRKNGKLKKIRKFGLKEAKKNSADSGKKHTLKLKFKGKTRKKLSKVIRRKKSKATVKVVATDEAGNASRKVKFKVTVKKPKKGKVRRK